MRGVDRDGDEFRIDRGYLAHGMRWRAQEILTRELGRRSEKDLSVDWAVDVGREAFTEIDRVIAEHSSPDGSVALVRILAAPERERLACLDRLQALEEMQLATQGSAGVWSLADGWKGFLVQRGEDRDARSRLQALVGDEASRYQVLRPENPVPVADGVVVGMGLHDELGGDMFAAIRTASGQGYYLRLPPSVAEKLQERDAVRVGFEVEPWLKPADRIVARFAQENSGTYDPVRHQRELEGLRHSPAGDGQPTPAERVNAFPIRMIPPSHSGAETAVVLGRTGAVQDRPPSSLPPFSGFVGTGGTAGGRRVGNTCRVKVAPARSCSATLARKPRYRVSPR